MKRLALLVLCSLTLVSCVEVSHFITIKTQGSVQDSNGETLSFLEAELCVDATTNDGNTEKKCEPITADVDGKFARNFSFNVDQAFASYRAYLVMDSREFEGEIKVESIADDNITKESKVIDVSLAFVIPSDLIARQTTIFNMSGNIANQDNGYFSNQNVLVCIFVSVKEGEAHRFKQCATTFTNEFGEYSIALAVESSFLFEVENELLETYVETSTVFGGGSHIVQDVSVDEITGERIVMMISNFAPKIPVSSN